MKLKCLLFGHKYGKWEYLGPSGKYKSRLIKKCKKCGKRIYFEGVAKKDKNNGFILYE
jgi:hypothetical protein